MRIGIKPENYCFDLDFSNVPTLFESEEIFLGDLFEYKGTIYRGCIHSKEHNFLLVKQININLESEESAAAFFSEVNDNRIKCPVCGNEDQDSWERDSEDDNYECGNCGAILEYSSETIRTFYIDVKEKPEIKKITIDNVNC